MHYGLTFFFLVGALAPIVRYVMHKKLHWNWMKYVNFVSTLLLTSLRSQSLTLSPARHLLRHWLPPARDAAQLRAGLHRRLHLQLRYPSPSLRLVVEVQLRALCRSRLGVRALVPIHGNTLSVQLVLDGMKLQPCRPGFFGARDAIIQADKVRTGGENVCDIWKAFASRGLGQDATVVGHTLPVVLNTCFGSRSAASRSLCTSV